MVRSRHWPIWVYKSVREGSARITNRVLCLQRHALEKMHKVHVARMAPKYTVSIKIYKNNLNP